MNASTKFSASQKGFAPILIIILIAAVIGGYLVCSGKINLNRSQPVATQSAPSPSLANNKNETANFAEGSPEATSNNFYQWYLNCLNNHFQKVTNGEKTSLNNCSYESSLYISQKLVDNFNKFEVSFKKQCGNSPVCSHGDLILCAQNTPASISVDKAKVDGNIANTIVHTFYSGSGDNPIKITLEKEGGNWQISDIECPKRN